jgi:hypothetical protein
MRTFGQDCQGNTVNIGRSALKALQGSRDARRSVAYTRKPRAWEDATEEVGRHYDVRRVPHTYDDTDEIQRRINSNSKSIYFLCSEFSKDGRSR